MNLREIDKRIAIEVMGLMEFCAYAGPHKASMGWGNPGDDLRLLKTLPNYSTSIEDAWMVVEAMKNRPGSPPDEFTIQKIDQGWRAGYMCFIDWVEESIAPTAPLAICKAALKSLEGKKNEI